MWPFFRILDSGFSKILQFLYFQRHFLFGCIKGATPSFWFVDVSQLHLAGGVCNPREQTNRVIGTNALWTKKSLFGRQVFLRSNSPYHLMNEINLTHLTRQIWHPSQSRINWSLNWLKSSNAWLLGLLASQLAPLLKSLSKCLLCLKHLTHPFLHIHHCHCLGYIWLARLNPE